MIKYKIITKQINSNYKILDTFELSQEINGFYKVGSRIQRYKQEFEVYKLINLKIKNNKHIHLFVRQVIQPFC